MKENKIDEDLIDRIEEVQSYGKENFMSRRNFAIAALLCMICFVAVIAGGFIV